MKYSDYCDVFLAKNVAEFSENIEINKYTIKLKEGKQPPYGPIYSLELIEFEIFKTYIEINLVNGFIRPSKSLTGAPSLINRKPDRNFRLYVNY